MILSKQSLKPMNTKSRPILSRIRDSKTFRGVSLLAGLCLLGETVWPTLAHAVTGGPGQPEMQQFQPYGTTGLVDPFTGDFKYNLPLMTVPGPNGGYPINLGYNAGIQMDQQASWAGLGWNVNVGAITRQVRGIPDDFKGETIHKETNLRVNETVTGKFTKMGDPSDFEMFGMDFAVNKGYQVSANNYNGIGVGFSLGLAEKNMQTTAQSGKASLGGFLKKHVSPGLSLSLDSRSGLGIAPSLAYGDKKSGLEQSFNAGVSFTSREGLERVSLSYGKNWVGNERANLTFGGAGTSFSRSSYIPGSTFDMNGSLAAFKMVVGDMELQAVPEFHPAGRMDVNVARSELASRFRDFNSYGLCYTQDADPTDRDAIMDFNRENDRPITRRSKTAPVPVQTHDIFSVSGQGMGGTFRAFRSDIPVYRDEQALSQTNGGGAGMEAGSGVSTPASGTALPPMLLTHMGVDANLQYTASYAGPWRTEFGELDNLGAVPASVDEPLYEPFYFRMLGENTALSTLAFDGIGGTDALAFDMKMRYGQTQGTGGQLLNDPLGIDLPSWEPHASKNYRSTAPQSIQDADVTRDERERRVQSVHHRTVMEIEDDVQYSQRAAHVYQPGANPLVDQPVQHQFPNQAGPDQIGDVTITDAGGMRHVYGLPAYNIKQEDVSFAVHEQGTIGVTQSFYDNPRTIPYNDADATLNNERGRDHYYHSSTTPAYAHSWMLTNMFSQDYVDLTGDGPSDDDLGYWVKFDYEQAHDANDPYRWRVPYKEAGYSKGKMSDPTDDKAQFTYGEKEIYFLRTIETKTHLAVFELGERFDGIDASARDNHVDATQNNNPHALQYLRKIVLYNKADLAQPLQTVNFAYDYSLCQGIPNNSGAAVPVQDPHMLDNQGGKLTLKRVWFTHLDNRKGERNFYDFNYGANPDYDAYAQDRWGSFQTDHANWRPHENPFVIQDADYNQDGIVDAADALARQEAAEAWNLKNIVLPSGGEIDVEYEQDKFSYVQDVQATQMLQLTGFLKEGDAAANGNVTQELGKKNQRVVFKLDQPLDAGATNAELSAAIQKYIEGQDEVLFKAWMRLKLDVPDNIGSLLYSGGQAYDYVTGYAKVKQDAIAFGTDFGVIDLGGGSDYTHAYFTISQADYHAQGNKTNVHPIRKAGWQYLRYERPDLLGAMFDPNVFSPANFTAVLDLFINAIGMLGFYNQAAIRGWCNKIDQSRPSFLRLTAPEGKYGGGCRVKAITLRDNWEEKDAEYTQRFVYENIDGSSSGVAQYEPAIGREANAKRKPIYDDGPARDRIFWRHPDAFVEGPINESYFPGPKVGYARVASYSTGEDLAGKNFTVTKALDGITVQEFYTAKDFPVISNHTDLKYKEVYTPILIPFVGAQEFHGIGFSQGFVAEVNDMHGKPKRMAVYAANTDFASEPVSETQYIYETDQGNISNEVDVLYDHGQDGNAYLGLTYDFFIAQQENADYGLNYGAGVNVDLVAVAGAPSPPLIYPGFSVKFEYSEQKYRTVTTNKIIYRNGLLKEVIVKTDGSHVRTENLAYDAETGGELLSKVTNEFDGSVFNYSYPGHWAYEGMEGNYQNIRANYLVTSFGSSEHYIVVNGQTATGIENYLTLGDELFGAGGLTYYVSAINTVNHSFTLELDNGNNVQLLNEPLTVMRSGHRNLQVASNGNIVSLQNNFTGIGAASVPGIMALLNEAGANNISYTISNPGPNAASGEIDFDEGNPIASCVDAEPNYVTISSANLQGGAGPLCDVGYDAVDLTFVGSTTTCRYYLCVPIQGTSFVTNFYDYEMVGYDANAGTMTWEHRTNGTQINGFFAFDPSNGATCDCTEENEPGRILHADAITFSDDWQYNYADVGNPTISGGQSLATALALGANEYRYGRRGIWRPKQNFVYETERIQSGTTSPYYETNISRDGEYEQFTFFDWQNVNSLPTEWHPATEMTRYNPYGYVLEDKNAIDVSSGEIYGYGNSVVTGTAANTQYIELATDGFEDHGGTYSAHGHFNLAGAAVSSDRAHTGDVSLRIPNGGSVSHTAMINTVDPTYWTPRFNANNDPKKYHLSAWISTENLSTLTIDAVLDGNVIETTTTGTVTGEVIDGWKRIELDFEIDPAQASVGIFELRFSANGPLAPVYVDDLRVHPYKAGMETFVYDPATLWLIASLDNRNYATFYSYDEEGKLVQVKKETERGVVTVSTSRKNIHQRLQNP